MKDLPKVFANKVEKDSGNNNNYSYNKNEERTAKLSTKNIHQKIKDIFNSPNYVYKADVDIEINGKILKRQIIGYNNNYLMTIDSEQIPINSIENIEFSSK